MTKKTTIFVLAALLTVSLTLSIEGQTGGDNLKRRMRNRVFMGGQDFFPVQMVFRFEKEIGLSPEQKKNIEKIRESAQIQAVKTDADLKLGELKLKSLLKQENVNRDEVKNQVFENSQLRANLLARRLNRMLDIKEMLTKEQLNKLQKIIKQNRLKKKRRGSTGNMRFRNKRR